MSYKILHITNGDSTTDYLKSIQLEGDFITWREMLCEGKTTTDVGSEDFWKTRFEFLNKSYKITKKTFIDFTLKEYRLLCQKKHQDQIILWFDNDLFCQINMLAVISWLKRYRKDIPVYLVSCNDVKDSQKSVGFSQLNKQEINHRYKQKIVLKQDDIEYADYIWQLYCSDSPLRLETVYKFNPMSPFKHLSKALEAHLKRFPSLSNGLNEIENSILKAANHNNFLSKQDLVKSLLKEQTIYGFGDIQFVNKIDELKKLFSSFNPVKLSTKGKKVLENQINYYKDIRTEKAFLGGAKKYSFLYVNNSKKLLQITS